MPTDICFFQQLTAWPAHIRIGVYDQHDYLEEKRAALILMDHELNRIIYQED